MPGELNVTARGENMLVRYPEGVRSTIDADLTIRGNVKAPPLGGAVTVRSALWNRARRSDGRHPRNRRQARRVRKRSNRRKHLPVRLRHRSARAGDTPRREQSRRVSSRARDLQLRGSLDRPLLFGSAEVDRGDVIVRRAALPRDEGHHRIHQPDPHRAFLRCRSRDASACPGRPTASSCVLPARPPSMVPELESDPPLPAADVLALLFSDVHAPRPRPGPGDVELRARQELERAPAATSWRHARRSCSPIPSRLRSAASSNRPSAWTPSS
mgnify:CR=1 FL=1